MDKKTSQLIAVVKKVLLNGLIVDVGGKQGFVPRRELDWNDPRIDPTAHFKAWQKISVVSLGEHEEKGRYFSYKLAKYDPWADKIEKYEKELKANHFPVVRGMVEDVTATCVYVVLEDYNKAVIFPRGIPSSQKNDPVNLNDLFLVGDHVEARIKDIRYKHRSFELDIEGHAVELAKKRRKQQLATPIATMGDVLPLAELGLQCEKEDRKKRTGFSNLRILIIEDDQRDRKKLEGILKRYNCDFVAPASETDLDSALERPDSFDLVFVDLNLDHWRKGLRGNKFINKIRRQSPTGPMIVITIADKEVARKAFSGAKSLAVIQKPLRDYVVEHYLSEISRGATASSLAAMRRMDQEARTKRDVLSMDQKLEDALDIILGSLCRRTDGQVKAAVLRMDLTTQEVFCVRSYGLDKIPWPDHKSTLRYTPIDNVIRWDEPLRKLEMPESRKKHFPKEIEFISFAGIPIQTFGEISHGLFLFGRGSGSIPREIYSLAHESALAIARLLERAMTDNILQKEALFASMGRLYMAMGHEIRDAVTGIKDLPGKLRQDIDALEIEDAKSKRTEIIKNMRNTVDTLKMAGDHILNLFDFYADLSQSDSSLQNINLDRLLDEVAKEMKRRHGFRETIFQVEVKGPFIIRGSEIKLRQVLRNLVLNACQQMEASGTLCPYVRMEAFLDTGSPDLPVKIMITDSGPGIHAKDWERIFEPWQSTRKKGAGLGLYISRLLTRAMGGRIRVYESFSFIGTSFIIELPKEMDHGQQ